MGSDDTLFGTFVDGFQGFSGVRVAGAGRNQEIIVGFLNVDQGFVKHLVALLEELADGVKVGGEAEGCRVCAFAVFSFTFSEELLEPLAEIAEVGLEGFEDFQGFALVLQGDAADGVIHQRAVPVRGACDFCGASQHGEDVVAGCCDRQEADCGQDRVSAADVVGHHEGCVAVFVRFFAQGTFLRISDDVDAVFGLDAVFSVELVLQDGVGQQRLNGGSGLGNDAEADIFFFHAADDAFQIGRTHVETGEHDFRAVFLAAVESVDDCFCAQVGAAYTNDDEQVALAANFLGCIEDTVEDLGVKLEGQVYPTRVFGFSGSQVVEPLAGRGLEGLFLTDIYICSCNVDL